MQNSSVVWRGFVGRNVLKHVTINQVIDESWQICRDAEPKSLQTEPKNILTTAELKQKNEANQELITLIKKGLNTIKELFKDLTFLVALSNGEGHVIWRSSQTKTNKGVQRGWNWLASPIFNKSNQVIGVLSISFLEKTEELGVYKVAIEMLTQAISNEIDIEMSGKQNKMSLYLRDKLPVQLIKKNYDLKPVLTKTTLSQEPLRTVPAVKEEKQENFIFQGVVGHSRIFQDFLDELRIVVKSSAPIHLTGETGTGKEIIAKSLHANSQAKKGPLIKVNCGALSSTLLESELFGYEGGAFTGADRKGKIGKLEAADKGTLFLDEVETMPMSMQLALLRVLEEKEVIPIGGNVGRKIEFHLITATNKNLQSLVQQGKFREDLFYRIYVIPLQVPALRERRDDMEDLILHFQNQRNWHPSWQELLLTVVKNYAWPGNIRELNNFLERTFVYFSHKVPKETDLERLIDQGSLKQVRNLSVLSFVEELELTRIKEALASSNGNKQVAAKDLGYARSTFYRKLAKYQL